MGQLFHTSDVRDERVQVGHLDAPVVRRGQGGLVGADGQAVDGAGGGAVAREAIREGDAAWARVAGWVRIAGEV